MMSFRNGLLTTITLAGIWATAGAEHPNTEHTYRLDKDEASPPATLDDVSWLVGAWSGEAFGNQFEEVWNPPSAGSMVGFFKLFNDSGVVFYEILLLVEEGDSIVMKVKHFNPDFTAWEEKEDYVTFRFIRADQDAIHFSGISFYRDGDDRINAYIVFQNGEEVREEKLTYRRTRL